MRVLSQSEIDNMLATLLADPRILPGVEPVKKAVDDAEKPVANEN